MLKIGRVKALFKEPKKRIETSGPESEYEFYLAAKLFALLKAAWGNRGIVAAATQKKKGKR